MRFVIYIFILSAHALCTMLSCDQEPQKTKVYNPNGDSELALLIRDLFDEAMEVKKDIKDGKTPKLRLDNVLFSAIHQRPRITMDIS